MIEVRNLTKSYAAKRGADAVRAVEDVSMVVRDGQFLTLLGPSGCGKTTLLRCLAGLERPERGLIRIGDRTVFSDAEGIDVPASRRQLGMVFQSYAIWPHMSVFDNVAFPLKCADRRMRGADIKRRVSESLELVGLAHTSARNATMLSGGQQQRLALARALVSQPRLLLLDEPLSNLDASLREEMRAQLRTLQQQIGVTTVYVTHDQSEALAMSDWLVVLRSGRIVQQGRPVDVYERPRTESVASFLGGSNLFRGRWTDASTCVLDTENRTVHIDAPAFAVDLGSSCTLAVRPERVRVSLTAPAESGVVALSGTVELSSFVGAGREYRVRLRDGREISSTTNEVHSGLEAGDPVYVIIDVRDWIVLEPDDPPTARPGATPESTALAEAGSVTPDTRARLLQRPTEEVRIS